MLEPYDTSRLAFSEPVKRNSLGQLTKKTWSSIQSKLAKSAVPPTPPSDHTTFDLDQCITPPSRDISVKVKPRNSLTISESLSTRISQNFGQFGPPTPVSPNGELFVNKSIDHDNLEHDVSDTESRIEYVVSEAACNSVSSNSSTGSAADSLDSQCAVTPEPMPSKEVFDAEHRADLDEAMDPDDLEDSCGPGLFAGLIQELKEEPNDFQTDFPLTVDFSPKAGSMHRQLSPKKRDSVAVTFFSETLPKQTSAQISTLSRNVFPIKEEPVNVGRF